MTMKPEFMRLRRAFAGVVAALLMAAGLVVLSPALSASAHHNTITVSASCTNYVWSINWTIVNSESDKTETITSSTDQAVIANGTVLAQAATYTKSEVVSGPMTKTLTVDARWNNGVTNTNSKTIYPSDFTGTCEAPDTPSISVTGTTCSTQSANNGTVTFALSGATKSYTVALMAGTTQKATTTSSGGTGSFSNVPPGTYALTATAGGVSVTSSAFTVSACAQQTPDIDLAIQPCVTGGALGAITANLTNLTAGTSYLVTLYSSDDLELDTLPLTATSTSQSMPFPGHGPGEYYVVISTAAGDALATSANATIPSCSSVLSVSVQLEPCLAPLNGTDRAINVQLAGLAASTVYTVQLLTDDAAQTVVASTSTPGDSATTFLHTFTAAPSPGDYVVKVTGTSTSVTSDSISAPRCDLTTLAPPSIELVADQCDATGTGTSPLSARMIDLDATKTYFVRIVDSTGATVAGGEDQEVSGSTTASVQFPKITSSGTYSAQLLINPGKQLAATSSPSAVDFSICASLPTLAMTGPGVLVPLGSVAALLLTLGGAVVTGRLRRRMAL